MTTENLDSSNGEETLEAGTDQTMKEIPTDVEMESKPASPPSPGASKYKFNHAEYERWSRSLRRKLAQAENEV